MINIRLTMKTDGLPLKRTPVTLSFDDPGRDDLTAPTGRNGIAEFQEAAGSGRVVVNGRTQFQGRLNDAIHIELWSLTDGQDDSYQGAPQGIDGGSIAYPGMQTRPLMVDGQIVLTDSEGYIVQPGEWSERYVEALAQRDELQLTDEHWEVIRYLRDYYNQRHVQATVRDMIKHFRKTWGKERGSNRYLHQIFPMGGPQKQGNRLAGLLRTKGEH